MVRLRQPDRGLGCQQGQARHNLLRGLVVTEDGRLVLYQGTILLWNSSLSSTVLPGVPVTNTNPAARLLDDGNLVLTAGSMEAGMAMSDVIVWQSFDQPCDTMLPDMKIAVDLKSGVTRGLTSWRSADDPAPGEYTYMMDNQGPGKEIYLRYKKTNAVIYRPGWWNGFRFSGNPRMEGALEVLNFTYERNVTEFSYRFDATGPAWMLLTYNGTTERRMCGNQRGKLDWDLYWMRPKDDCDGYNRCGPNGLCDNDKPNICGCFPGFRPVKASASGTPIDYQLGCQRKVPLNCSQDEGFRQVPGVKLPDTAVNATVLWNEHLSSCEGLCKKNCNCVAYASANLTSKTGCIMWFGDLIDSRSYSAAGSSQDDLFLRLPASELGAQLPLLKRD